MSLPILRFAPSPTGLLHIGNLRTALLNWLFARHEGGQVVLRLDDTDSERCEEFFVRAIRDDLAWAGLVADKEVRQSERVDAHDRAFERLREEGLIYPCYESAEELERKRKVLLERKRPPIYDRAALRLSKSDRTALEAEGRKPHWRFLLPKRTLHWEDMICGEQRISTTSLSDPVVRRPDGNYLYMLPSVIDDIEMQVSHVIRGADHIPNTAVQLCLFEALEGQTPRFGHHSLLLAADGSKLSKRMEGLSLARLRGEGIEPMALLCLLARLGSPKSPRLAFSVTELARDFSLRNFSRAPARFDHAALNSLNARILHDMSFERANLRLESLNIGGGEAFWIGVRRNLSRFDEVLEWWQVISEPLDPVIDVSRDGAMLARARDCLPSPPWSTGSYGEWIRAAKKATGRSGKRLFLPLRLALTGKDRGPELEVLLPIMGYDRVVARLSGRRA